MKTPCEVPCAGWGGPLRLEQLCTKKGFKCQAHHIHLSWKRCLSRRARWPWLIRTDIPPLLQYPVGDAAFPFVCGLIAMFYGPSLGARLDGLLSVARCFLFPPRKPSAAKGKKSN